MQNYLLCRDVVRIKKGNLDGTSVSRKVLKAIERFIQTSSLLSYPLSSFYTRINSKCANAKFAVKITDDQTWRCLIFFQLPVYIVITKPSYD